MYILSSGWTKQQHNMQKLYCQSGLCRSHEIRQWKWDKLWLEIYNNGRNSEGVLCRPCAEHKGLVHQNQRHSPYPYSNQKFAKCPWNLNKAKELHEAHLAKLKSKIGDVQKAYPENQQKELKRMVLEQASQE